MIGRIRFLWFVQELLELNENWLEGMNEKRESEYTSLHICAMNVFWDIYTPTINYCKALKYQKFEPVGSQ